MTIEELDIFLNSMTEKEIIYRKEYEKNCRMEPSKIHPKNITFDWIPSDTKIKGLDLSIKKNSRYNPLPKHNHDHIELVYVYSGVTTHHFENESVTLKKGQLLLIDVNTHHSVDMLGINDITINICVSKKFLHTNLLSHLSTNSTLASFLINAMNKKTQSLKYINFNSKNNRRLPIFMNEFLCESYNPSTNYVDMLNNFFGLIIAELVNIFEENLCEELNKKNKASVIPMLQYIEENYNNCTLEFLSKKFEMNPNYLSALLKKQIGMSYSELIQHKRLIYAVTLLKNTEMPITEIANEIGYENINFFYQKFKKKYGCTPKEFRDKY